MSPNVYISRLIYPQFLPSYYVDRHLQHPGIFLNLIWIIGGGGLSAFHDTYIENDF